MKTYKGKWRPKNLKKYLGDPNKITYRSLWERNAFRWFDANDSIKGWVSEEVIVPYICETDGKRHRYFVDIYFETVNGAKFLIEIKPNAQTKPPKNGRRTKRLLNETLTYVKNQSKWKAADKFAKDNGCQFQIWDEYTLESLGIKTSVGKLKNG